MLSEIAERWWTGEPSGGSERWAFAFSAMKSWQKKVRADVANIVSTGRDYKRIYFFTNQFVSDKARAKVEDELKKSTGVPFNCPVCAHPWFTPSRGPDDFHVGGAYWYLLRERSADRLPTIRTEGGYQQFEATIHCAYPGHFNVRQLDQVSQICLLTSLWFYCLGCRLPAR